MNWGAVGAILGLIGTVFAAGVWATRQENVGEKVKSLEAQISELKTEIKVPHGAVVAFHLEQCPAGWTPYDEAAGRTIIGIGQGTGLTLRRLGDRGGEESHVLSVSELPSHVHPGFVGTGGASFEHHQNNSRLPGTAWARETGATGGSQAHNNMPPFVSLRYCRKN